MTIKPKTPDAELIALGMQLDAAWTHEKSLDADRNIPEDVFDAAVDASHAIVGRIEELAATTLAGAKVKAKAIWWCHNGEEIEDDYFNMQCATDGRLAAGLVRDILAIGSKHKATQSTGAGAAINRRWRKLDSGEVVFQVHLKSLADLRGKALAGLPVQDRIDEVIDALLRYRTQAVHEPLALCSHGEPGQDWGSA